MDMIETKVEAVAYYRVSSQQQGKSGLGLDAQRHSVESYARLRKLTIVQEFTEVETATSKRQRKEITRAVEAAKSRGAVLLIGKLDRLARSVSFISNLMESGVDFVAVDMPDANRLTVHIMAALAEHEARLISVRTSDALRAARERGKSLGSPDNLTDEARAAGRAVQQQRAKDAYRKQADYIRTLHENGLGYRAIARRLNESGHKTRRGKEWSATQVSRVLKKYIE